MTIPFGLTNGKFYRDWQVLAKSNNEIEEHEPTALNNLAEVSLHDDHAAHLSKHRADLANAIKGLARAGFDLSIARAHKNVDPMAIDQQTRFDDLDEYIDLLHAHIQAHELAMKRVDPINLHRRARLW